MRLILMALGFVSGLMLLGGCTSGNLVHMDIFSVVATDKTLVDHAVSLGSGKNCSSVRVEQGMRYCEEDELKIKPAVHCYKTLGRVSCYEQKDPYKTNRPEIGNNDHNLTN